MLFIDGNNIPGCENKKSINQRQYKGVLTSHCICMIVSLLPLVLKVGFVENLIQLSYQMRGGSVFLRLFFQNCQILDMLF